MDAVAGFEVGPPEVEVGDAAALLARFFVEEGFAMPAEGMVRRADAYRRRDGNAILLARAPGAAIGVATVATGFSLEYGRVAEIEDLYVVPGWRRRGVATTLVERACRWAGERGCSAALVTVTPEGGARYDLVRFYGNLGFRDDGRRLLERRL